jgi:transcriptional regulator with XRE-family HTH domain
MDSFAKRLKYIRLEKGLNRTAFAKSIGVSSAHISALEKEKGSPSEQFVKAVAARYDFSEKWLSNGEGEMHPCSVHQPQPDYDQHGGWKPRSIEEMAGVPKGLGMGKAVDLLATIYAAKDEMLIRAINANLEAFCGALDDKKRRLEREIELERLEARIAELENIIAKNGPIQVYSGPDRRNGTDRRTRFDPEFPSDQNQRNGTDRRKEHF